MRRSLAERGGIVAIRATIVRRRLWRREAGYLKLSSRGLTRTWRSGGDALLPKWQALGSAAARGLSCNHGDVWPGEGRGRGNIGLIARSGTHRLVDRVVFAYCRKIPSFHFETLGSGASGRD